LHVLSTPNQSRGSARAMSPWAGRNRSRDQPSSWNPRYAP
jgi:hypothetical protein